MIALYILAAIGVCTLIVGIMGWYNFTFRGRS